jgi:two-component system, OmpR family, sensor histidine kinase KdpD
VTVSIGQLESLTDVVEKITGAVPRQTVPDPLVRAADEVELVDVAPDALRDRMADGQIYPPPTAEAVLAGWFRIGNLSVLRELALLWLAATLASDPRRYRPGGDVLRHAGERVVVALGGGEEGETLIRWPSMWSGLAAQPPLAVPHWPPSAGSSSRSAGATASWLTKTSRLRCWRSRTPRVPLSWYSAQPAAPGWPGCGPEPASARR